MKVLFIAKESDIYGAKAAEYIQTNYTDALIVIGKRGEPAPSLFSSWKGDLIISYLSPWIIPQDLLERASFASINFHPGSPDYPGIGCTNFALYNGEKEFGITCHHMLPKVDTGTIIAVSRFPIEEQDSVWTLTQRCYVAIFELFIQVMNELKVNGNFAKSGENWTRVAYKRKELNELCRITLDMDEQEVIRRIRATTFPNMPGAFIELYGKRFNYSA
jgi:methionyl-tRNA formyltransferase